MPSTSAFAGWLQAAVRELGGLDAGCLRVDGHATPELAARFAAWLAAGNRGRLAYLDQSVAERARPFTRLPEAKSVVVVLFRGNWADGAAREATHRQPKVGGDLRAATAAADGSRAARPPDDPAMPHGPRAAGPGLPPPEPDAPVGYVSLYAAGQDYHAAGRHLLMGLAQRLQAEHGAGPALNTAVDTMPIPEVFLAAAAGLGGIGRNCLLRTPQHGSRVFIGSLWFGTELPEVRNAVAVAPACADCGACVRACPTGALAADGFVHLDLCRSYLTMECRRALTHEQATRLGTCVFGCDACTACCPPALAASHGTPVDLTWLVTAPTAEVRRALAGTALAHAGVTLLRRNAAAALANSGHPRALDLLDALAGSSQSPVVQETLANLRQSG